MHNYATVMCKSIHILKIKLKAKSKETYSLANSIIQGWHDFTCFVFVHIAYFKISPISQIWEKLLDKQWHFRKNVS